MELSVFGGFITFNNVYISASYPSLDFQAGFPSSDVPAFLVASCVSASHLLSPNRLQRSGSM